MVNEAVNKVLKENEENTSEGESVKEDKKSRTLPSLIENTLSLLSFLVCQPGGKASFLNLITTTSENVSEYDTFIANLLNIQKKETDWFYLENCLLPLVLSLIEHELCLSNSNGKLG